MEIQEDEKEEGTEGRRGRHLSLKRLVKKQLYMPLPREVPRNLSARYGNRRRNIPVSGLPPLMNDSRCRSTSGEAVSTAKYFLKILFCTTFGQTDVDFNAEGSVDLFPNELSQRPV